LAGIREEVSPQAASEPETAVIAGDMLSKALSSLPPQQRMALVMMEAEGMTSREIAQSMETSYENVRVLIHRARKGVLSFVRQDWRDSSS